MTRVFLRSPLSRSARAAALGLLIAAAAGCAHTHTHAPPPPPAAVAATKPDHELGAQTGVPVSSTPQGLMHDGAERMIQEQLRTRGLLRAEQCTGELDADTQVALRTFQKREGLPTTGLPSYETVEHLGLKLSLIFRTTAHPAIPPPRRSGSPG